MSEARALAGEHACVVGGGNSAGQAAMHLAQFAESVTIVVRSDTLAASMSDYLVKSIERTPNIDIRFETEVAEGGGDGRLEWIDLKDRTTGAIERVAAAALFVLIGADPCTDWLPSSVQRDAWGYIATGGHCECHIDSAANARRSCSRRPCRASSPSATSDKVRSSASRPLRAKERSASDSSTTTSTNSLGQLRRISEWPPIVVGRASISSSNGFRSSSTAFDVHAQASASNRRISPKRRGRAPFARTGRDRRRPAESDGELAELSRLAT